MGGEDFAYLLEKVPGAILFLGIGNASQRTDVNLHNPRFKMDENQLHLGAALHVALAGLFHTLKSYFLKPRTNMIRTRPARASARSRTMSSPTTAMSPGLRCRAIAERRMSTEGSAARSAAGLKPIQSSSMRHTSCLTLVAVGPPAARPHIKNVPNTLPVQFGFYSKIAVSDCLVCGLLRAMLVLDRGVRSFGC